MKILNQSKSAISVLDGSAYVSYCRLNGTDVQIDLRFPDDYHRVLGTYKSEPRARQVLSEMLRAEDYYEMPPR